MRTRSPSSGSNLRVKSSQGMPMRMSVRVNARYPAEDPKFRTFIEICLISAVGRSRRVSQDSAVRGVGNSSGGRQ
jgi:hypothetical protein